MLKRKKKNVHRHSAALRFNLSGGMSCSPYERKTYCISCKLYIEKVCRNISSDQVCGIILVLHIIGVLSSYTSYVYIRTYIFMQLAKTAKFNKYRGI